ncbi:hypothetical protein [Mesoplasma seiffertii]|uniref:hypothetical protein n=1 Tax=Mesoplasma seiffertii TaxID=28224 RepID=UPI00047E9E36|nr:hypothetical protein [Mesoplasma seiffertii]
MKNLLRILYSGIVIAPASLALVSVKYDNTTVANPKETTQEVNFNNIRSEFINNFNDESFANLDEAMKSIRVFPNKTNMKSIYVKQVTVNSNVSASTNINNYVAFDVKLSLVDEINTTWNIPGVDQIFTLTTYIDNRNLIEKSAYQQNLEEYIVADGNEFFKNSLEVKKRILKYNQIRSNDTVITSVTESDIVSKESDKVYKQKYQVNVIALDTYKWSTDKTSEVIEVIVQIDNRGYVDPQEVAESIQSSVANMQFNSVANAQKAIETAEKVDGIKEIKAVFDKEAKTTINGKVLFNVTVSVEEDFKWKDGTAADKSFSVEAFVDARNEINKNDIEVAMNKHIEAKGHFENPQAIIAAINEFKFTGISNVKGELANKQQKDLVTTSFKVSFDVDIDYKLKDNVEPAFYFDYEYAALLNIKDVETQLNNSLKEVEIYQKPEEVIAKLERTEILGIKEIKVQELAKTRTAINGTFEVSLVADEGYLFEDLKNTTQINISQNYAKIIKNSDVQTELQSFLNEAHYESEKDIVTAIETKFVFSGLKNFKVISSRSSIMKAFTVSFDTEPGYEMAKNDPTQVVVQKDYAILLKTAEIKANLEAYLEDKHFESSQAIINDIQSNFEYEGIEKITVAEAKSPITKQYIVTFETRTGYALEKDDDNKFSIQKDYAILLKTALIQTELNKYLGNKSFETADEIVNTIETKFSYTGVKNIKVTYPKGNAKGIVTKTFTVTFDTADGYALAPGESNSFTVQKSYVKYIKTQLVIDSIKAHIGTQEFDSQKEFIDFIVQLDDPMYQVTNVSLKVEGGNVFIIDFEVKDGFELNANEKKTFELNTEVRYSYGEVMTTEHSNDFSVSFNNLLYLFTNEGTKTIVHTLNADREYTKVLELDENISTVYTYEDWIYVGTMKGNIIIIHKDNKVEKVTLASNGKPIGTITSYARRIYILGLNLKVYRATTTGSNQYTYNKFDTYQPTISGAGKAYTMFQSGRFLFYSIDNINVPFIGIDPSHSYSTLYNMPGVSNNDLKQPMSAFITFGQYDRYGVYSTGYSDDLIRYVDGEEYTNVQNQQSMSIPNAPSGTATKFVKMGENVFFTMKSSGKVYSMSSSARPSVKSGNFDTKKDLKSFDKLNGELYFTGNNFIGIRNSHIKLK